jgi:phytoene dehydrogenase-like protein
MGRTSPFFAELGLARHGVQWVDPPLALGHPLDDGSAVLVHRDLGLTAEALGPDAGTYRRLLGPMVRAWEVLLPEILAPFHLPAPGHAARFARFALLALRSAASLARRFEGPRARALVAGAAAHSILRLEEPVSGAAALFLLASAHHDGWPFPAGGAGRITDALVRVLEGLGGEIVVRRPVRRLSDLPPHRVALFDLRPRQLVAIAGERLSPGERRTLTRFRHGPGVFKLDAALTGPIPWRAADLAAAGTVHVGGTFEEIARSEAEVARGRVPERPFVLVAQQSLFDPSRAPAGRHTLWAYCHVPNGSTADMTEPVLRQIERFAPGFRERVLAVSTLSPAALEAYNANDAGGDIAGGRQDWRQLLTRPSWRLRDPYATSHPSLFLCSASTPPGGGVHGMCGFHAARSALRRLT